MSIRFIKDASIEDVKREMTKMLHEGAIDIGIRHLAERAIKSEQTAIQDIFDFVRTNFPYISDPVNTELFIHPRVMARSYFNNDPRYADCDDFALLTASMLQSVGFESRIAIIARGLDFDHAFTQVNTPDGWINLDTSNKEMPLGWEQKFNKRELVV